MSKVCNSLYNMTEKEFRGQVSEQQAEGRVYSLTKPERPILGGRTLVGAAVVVALASLVAVNGNDTPGLAAAETVVDRGWNLATEVSDDFIPTAVKLFIPNATAIPETGHSMGSTVVERGNQIRG